MRLQRGIVSVALAACVLLLAPRPVAGQAEMEMESGFALLVWESSAERLAGVAASSLPGAAADGLRVSPGLAALHAAGRRGESATARAARGLREDRTPGAAARLAADGDAPLHLAVLAPDCESGEAGAGSFVGSVEVRTGRLADGCYVAVAVQAGEAAALDRMISALREDGGRPLPDRLTAALEAALPEEPALRTARSAALWIAAPEPGETGVAGSSADEDPVASIGLRLQAEDHPRPLARLGEQLRVVRARELARRAGDRIAAGRYEGAAALADSALELDPGSTAAWMQRGRALLFDERDDDAEEAFRRMLELDPTALRFLGDPTAPSVNRDVIPYRPRLLLRLDVYRRAYFRTVDFGPDPAEPEGLPPAPEPADRDTGSVEGSGG